MAPAAEGTKECATCFEAPQPGVEACTLRCGHNYFHACVKSGGGGGGSPQVGCKDEENREGGVGSRHSGVFKFQCLKLVCWCQKAAG